MGLQQVQRPKQYNIIRAHSKKSGLTLKYEKFYMLIVLLCGVIIPHVTSDCKTNAFVLLMYLGDKTDIYPHS